MNKIHTNTAIDNHALLTLYNLFVEADKYVANKARDNCFKYTHTNINMVSQIPRPHMFSSHFFPKHILEYIDETALHKIQYICKIKGRTVNIYFVLNDYMYDTLKTQNIHFIDNYIRMMYMWIYTLSAFSNTTCSKTLSVYVYLTPFQKVLPDNQLITISTEHVNTAYTTHCKMNNEIVIYRQEEWFKVFVHETFHTFGIDFSMFTIDSYQSQLQSMFNVSTNIFLYEAYCETWARVINIIIYTTLMQKNQSFKTIKKTCIEYFQKETVHSMVQASKILKFMGLNYNILTSKHNDLQRISQMLYKESTNVLCYYIITALLMFYLDEFFSWCLTNNNDIICIPKKTKNVQLFVDFIKDHYLQEQFVELMNECITMEEELRDPSIKMTCFMTMTK
jgi:hypothetical protein